ncbi:hypothetical protein Pelo_15295 [Pelomyxa schiedti]|nr:hypothetical protein Pelo_15295 [Pelomyxa schiedti]
MSTHVGIKDATYARSQFIALGAAVVVGRCARGGDDSSCCSRAPVSALTPPLLSLIGREWVVFAAKRIAIDLTSGGGAHHELITLSVSPTLGLVHGPRVAKIDDFNFVTGFRGWVGPSTHRLNNYKSNSNSAHGNGHDPEERFALLKHKAGPIVVVIDTDREIPKMSLTQASYAISAVLYANRKWAAVIHSRRMSLWNLDGIELGIVTKVENMALPFAVNKAAFDGDEGGSGSSLVVACIVSDVCSVMVIDLEATLEQRMVIGRITSVPSPDRAQSVHGVLCWKGIHYILHSRSPSTAGLLCLETGKRTQLGDGNAKPIGGPYFAVTLPSRSEGYCIEVRSVLEPTKVCCVHYNAMESTMFTMQEIAVRGTGALKNHRPGDIEIIDALSGNQSKEVRGMTMMGTESQLFNFGRHHPDAVVPVTHRRPRSGSSSQRGTSSSKLLELIVFSVSPMLGLVDLPADIDIDIGAHGRDFVDFRGWVGPRRSTSHNAGAPARFALLGDGDTKLCMGDTKGHAHVQIPVTLHIIGDRCYNGRRWFCIHNCVEKALSVWNSTVLAICWKGMTYAFPLTSGNTCLSSA